MLNSARNLSVLKQFTYMDLKVFITVSQKMTCLIGVILAIKISKKKTVKTLIPDQIAFAAVVYFVQVFAVCRLINKSVLKWFLLIMCLNNAYYDKIYPFCKKPSYIAFD